MIKLHVRFVTDSWVSQNAVSIKRYFVNEYISQQPQRTKIILLYV